MNKISVRALAKASHISHTKLYDTAKIRRVATSRGLWEQVKNRVVAGEKQTTILAELMPDVANERKVKQQINQYRSTTRWLLNNGFQANDLIAFICEEIGKDDLAAQVSIYLHESQ